MQRFSGGWAALSAAVLLPAAAVDETSATALSARWMSAYNSGDLGTLTAIYAKDARVQEGYCPAVLGRSAIAEFWNEDLGGGGVRTELYVLDSVEVDDLVYLSGKYAVVDPQRNGDPVGGTFSQIWRRDRGAQWTVHRESWNNFACLEVKPKVRPDAESNSDAFGISL
jgi:ketosteroid isomerase-like protein